MCWVSFPALFLPPRPSYFSVKNIICFCRYGKIMGRYTSAESATIFLWRLNNWHSVGAFNARLFYFHIFCKCECRFLHFLPQRSERTCCILWQSSDYSFLFQAQHWGEVISLPNSECKVIRRRKWKTGFLDLDWKPSTFSFQIGSNLTFIVFSSYGALVGLSLTGRALSLRVQQILYLKQNLLHISFQFPFILLLLFWVHCDERMWLKWYVFSHRCTCIL